MSFIIHRQICIVPRQWLGFTADSLEVVLCKAISGYLRKGDESMGCSIRIEGVAAYLRFYNGHPWMQRIQDDSEQPELKDYLSVNIPCAYCTEL